MEYNDLFDLSEKPNPYEYFRFRSQFNLSPQQPAISNIHVVGLLAGTEIEIPKNHTLYCGVFQHLNYYDSE